MFHHRHHRMAWDPLVEVDERTELERNENHELHFKYALVN